MIETATLQIHHRIFVFAASLFVATPASAVDIVNRDRVPREVVVNRADGSSETVNLKPGERTAKVCADCVVLMGESSVEAKGDVTVRIEGGKAVLTSQR